MCILHACKPIAAIAVLLLPFAISPAQQVSQEISDACSGKRLELELPPMTVFDANDDRLVSAEEAAGCEILAMLFSRLDLDASRTLTAEEYEAFPQLWRRHARTFEYPE